MHSALIMLDHDLTGVEQMCNVVVLVPASFLLLMCTEVKRVHQAHCTNRLLTIVSDVAGVIRRNNYIVEFYGRRNRLKLLFSFILTVVFCIKMDEIKNYCCSNPDIKMNIK